jgi:glyceraldehyde 3-phosphate dehydrogenase
MRKIKIAINGFGRIGRLFLRQIVNEKNFEVVAINDLGDAENLRYLLKYDSVYGRFAQTIDNIKFLQEKEPANLPWKALDVDIVVEATGVFESFEKAKAHLDSGAKRVVLTAPAKDSDSDFGKTVLVGINDSELKSVQISSNASCTTNAVAPLMVILNENPGIEKAVLNTAHAITNTQAIVDSPVKGSDFRRGRAASQNIIPSTTGAAVAATRVVKDLEGKFDGITLRVPVITGSIADITFISKRKTSAEEINEILKSAAQSERWKEIIKTAEDGIVSSDIVAEPYAAIVDLKFTRVVDGNLVKVLSWYDNEWGYAAMLKKHVLKAAENL